MDGLFIYSPNSDKNLINAVKDYSSTIASQIKNLTVK